MSSQHGYPWWKLEIQGGSNWKRMIVWPYLLFIPTSRSPSPPSSSWSLSPSWHWLMAAARAMASLAAATMLAQLSSDMQQVRYLHNSCPPPTPLPPHNWLLPLSWVQVKTTPVVPETRQGQPSPTVQPLIFPSELNKAQTIDSYLSRWSNLWGKNGPTSGQKEPNF